MAFSIRNSVRQRNKTAYLDHHQLGHLAHRRIGLRCGLFPGLALYRDCPLLSVGLEHEYCKINRTKGKATGQ